MAFRSGPPAYDCRGRYRVINGSAVATSGEPLVLLKTLRYQVATGPVVAARGGR